MTTTNLPYPFSKSQITTGSVPLLKVDISEAPDWRYNFTATIEVLEPVFSYSLGFYIPILYLWF